MPSDAHTTTSQPSDAPGPGWLPAIMAATVMMGIIGFVTCAFSTWFLFQHRSEMAVRTLRGSLIPQIEQGRLQPETKVAVIDQLDALADDLQAGKYENWQAAAVMSGLVSLPIDQWGDLQAIELQLIDQTSPTQPESLKHLSRLQRAAELGRANAIDFDSVLEPVRVADDSRAGTSRLKQPLTPEDVDEVVSRAKLVADRADIPDQVFHDIHLESMIRREIQQGLQAP